MKFHRPLAESETADLKERIALIDKRQATITKVLRKQFDLFEIEKKTLERIALLEKCSGEDEKDAEELVRRQTQLKLLNTTIAGTDGELGHGYEQLRLAVCGLRNCIEIIGRDLVAHQTSLVAEGFRHLYRHRHVAIAKAQETDLICDLDFFFGPRRAPYSLVLRSQWAPDMILAAAETQSREAQALLEGGDIFPDSVALEDEKD